MEIIIFTTLICACITLAGIVIYSCRKSYLESVVTKNDPILNFLDYDTVHNDYNLL